MVFSESCTVNEIQQLRVPSTYRLKLSCNTVSMEVELHGDVVPQPRISASIDVEITRDKEKCLEKYFCANGYVVSTSRIGDTYRTVISLHGLLVVIKSPSQLDLRPMDKIYFGLTVK
ncbi:MAG: DNA-directed RNA polymerase subunit G [Desulfurococcus sp.]|uniref:DNA-directed RNA polymerase subunit G n=1 Tax=Desulfurococcus sp. TaxID=51678 RepID=UPI00315F517D